MSKVYLKQIATITLSVLLSQFFPPQSSLAKYDLKSNVIKNNSGNLISEEARAVNINFFGGFTGFDENSYKIFKTAMANLLVEGVIDHYITTAWGFEGGTSICVELSKDPTITLNKITDILQVIKPVNNTVYNYSISKACTKAE